MTLKSRIINALLPPTYVLKPNPFFDFSHWETVNDWSKVVLPLTTLGLITKATEGKNWVDETFETYFRAFKHYWPNLFRGAYHFFQPNDIAGQADSFTKTILKAGLDPAKDLVILDTEYIPPKWKKNDMVIRGEAYAYQVEALLEMIEDRLGNQPIIYWSKNVVAQMLDKNGNPPNWINKYWNWVAWYPETPYINLNTWIPNSALPLSLKPERVAGWQYATNWVIPGINYDGVDVNSASQIFLNSLSHTIPEPEPTPEPVVQTYPFIKNVDIVWADDASGTTHTERH